MSATDFSFPDHIPLSLDEVVAGATQEVQDACQGNVKCIFDATQTGNMDIGLNTMQTEEVFMEDQMIACKHNSRWIHSPLLKEKLKTIIGILLLH